MADLLLRSGFSVRLAARRVRIAAVTAALCWTGSVAAQQDGYSATANAPAARLAIEEVVIRASRFERENASSLAPVTVLDAEALSRRGALSAEEILRELPFFGTQGIPSGPSGGLAFLDLRNLGPARTLVLVNGRRLPASNLRGTDAVDVSQIPLGLVERVEVFRDGTSALYGSEAIGGAVNFVLRDRLDGLRLDALSGIAGEGDGRELALELSGGREWDRGRVLFSLRGSERNKVRLLSRGRSARSIGGVRPDGGLILGDTMVAEGRVEGDGQFFRPDPASGRSFSAFDSPGLDQRFNAARDFNLATPMRAFALSALGAYALSDTVELYFESTGMLRQSRLPRFPVALRGLRTSRNPDGFRVPLREFPQDYQDALRSGEISIPGIDPAALGPDTRLPVVRRLEEVGRTQSLEDVRTLRAVAGLRGERSLGSLGTWTWDAFFNYGRTDTDFQFENAVNLTRANLSADSERCAQVAGCVPGDFLGARSLSPQAARFIRTRETDRLLFRLRTAGVTASGPLVELPGGTAELTLGAEYREEAGFNRPDARKRSGASTTSELGATRGDFLARELFLQLELPLLRELPGFESLRASVSTRLSDFSRFGTRTQYRYALSWAPLRSLRLRAALSRSLRAPGISERFGGMESRFRDLVDPCSGLDAERSPAELLARCRDAGVPQGFVQEETETPTLGGGNRDLRAEDARFVGAGLVWTPQFAPSLSFSADYYEIRIEDAISALDPQRVLDSCFAHGASLSSPDCQRVQRTPGSGTLSQVRAGLDNIGELETRGLDLELGYSARLPALGSVEFRVAASYLFDLEQRLPGGRRKLNGTISPGTSSIPNARGLFEASFSPLSAIDLSVTAQYIGRADASSPAPFDEVSDRLYLDASLGYELGERWSLALGVKNLADREPPRALDFANTSVLAYDTVGRFGFARLTARF